MARQRTSESVIFLLLPDNRGCSRLAFGGWQDDVIVCEPNGARCFGKRFFLMPSRYDMSHLNAGRSVLTMYDLDNVIICRFVLEIILLWRARCGVMPYP
jgi:hypothetical protein